MRAILKLFNPLAEKQITYTNQLDSVINRLMSENEDRTDVLAVYSANQFDEDVVEWTHRSATRTRNYFEEYVEGINLSRDNYSEIIKLFIGIISELQKSIFELEIKNSTYKHLLRKDK